MKKATVLLLGVLLAAVCCGCGQGADIQTAPQTSQNLAVSETVSVGQGVLPDLSENAGKLVCTLAGVQFEMPKSGDEFMACFCKGNSENLIFLDKVPELPCEIPGAITEELLSGMTKLDEPSIPSLYEASYISGDKKVTVNVERISATDALSYEYSVTGDSGKEILRAYYLIETGRLTTVAVYVENQDNTTRMTAEYDARQDGDEAYERSVTQHLVYDESGAVKSVQVQADGYYFITDDYGREYKATVFYDVTADGLAVSQGNFYCVFYKTVGDTEQKTDMLYLVFDDTNTLSGVKCYVDSAGYIYDVAQGQWYDPEGKAVTIR